MNTRISDQQQFHVNRITPQVRNWNRNAFQGLTYIFTDKGPMKVWLHHLGEAEGHKCVRWIPQNAANLLRWERAGNGTWGSTVEAEKDEEWCEAVYDLLKKT